MFKAILTIYVLLLCISCQDFERYEDIENTEKGFVENYSQSDINRSIEIDFSLSAEKFLENIESKLGRNICNNHRFLAHFNYQDKVIYFEVFMLKGCDNFLPSCNKSSITTVISNSGEVSSEGIAFDNNDKLSQNIYTFTQERSLYRNKEYQLYELYWGDKTDPALTKEVLYGILRGIEVYKNKHANFKTSIVLNSRLYQAPPPPPPLPLKYRE